MRRENLGVGEGMSATPTSLESRDTKDWHQQLNNLIEACTGYNIGHREVRAS